MPRWSILAGRLAAVAALLALSPLGGRIGAPVAAALGAPRIAHAGLTAQVTAPDTSAAARQLEAGEQWFRAVCVECHADNVADADFKAKWNGRSVYDLFDRMRSSMPDSDPGSLTYETYVALTAYLMKLNGMPSRTAPVPADSSALANLTLAFPSSHR